MQGIQVFTLMQAPSVNTNQNICNPLCKITSKSTLPRDGKGKYLPTENSLNDWMRFFFLFTFLFFPGSINGFSRVFQEFSSFLYLNSRFSGNMTNILMTLHFKLQTNVLHCLYVLDRQQYNIPVQICTTHINTNTLQGKVFILMSAHDGKVTIQF